MICVGFFKGRRDRHEAIERREHLVVSSVVRDLIRHEDLPGPQSQLALTGLSDRGTHLVND